MKYAKAKDGKIVQYPYGMKQLKVDNPHTIYHSNDIAAIYPTTIDGRDNGFYLVAVEETPPPAITPYERLCEELPYRDAEGVWRQFWSIVKLSDEAVANIKNSKWADIREIRNQKLRDCDWTQMPDSPVQDSLWHPYRQALRDITLQDDPFNIVWPEPPG